MLKMKLFNRGEMRSVWNAMKMDIFTTRLFFDPLAVPLTIFFSKVKWITPNKVTLMALLPGVIGAFFFMRGNFYMGALGYYLFFLLDSVDGKLARLTTTFDPLGAFYDFVVDRIVISVMTFGMCISFIRLEMIPEVILSFAFIIIFFLKDVFDLKWSASGVVKKADSNESVASFGILARYKIHFKPGQLLSCFVVFIGGPLSGAYCVSFCLGILCLLFSMLSNVVLPYASYLKDYKNTK